MKKNIRYILIILFYLHVISGYSQAPFNRGVNLTTWFQVSNPRQIQFTKYTYKDIQNIKSLGCDVIRLPVNMHSMTSGAPSFTLDPVYVAFLDSIVKWCEKEELYIMIDNHSFDPAVNTTPDIEDILTKVWVQTASYFKDRSAYILYEILNEPHGISTSDWGSIQVRVIKAIREKDTKHTIVIGGSGYNSYNELSNLPVYNDANLLYTFHFYDPFVFTHQGASWNTPSMVPLAGVPFPYDAIKMPSCPVSLKGSWIESGLNNYSTDGTVAAVKQLIDIALKFRNARKVNLFCGEFGVYIPNSPAADRIFWYDEVRKYFEQNDIPWTIWDYQGGFGLFNKGSNELFDHDLNLPLLQALGLNTPEQTPFAITPDEQGFMIYSDYTGPRISDASGSAGIIDFYSSDLPNNGIYCISWDSFRQYQALSFDFKPDKDLSLLNDRGYAIDFMVRGNHPEISFEVRFIDNVSEVQDDKPWRMSKMVDKTMVQWDRRWHNVHIPFSEMQESGAWHNETWYNPEGKFDWSAVDRFQISIEHTGTFMQNIWFDNIAITDQDTAVVREIGPLGINDNILPGSLKIRAWPNPAKESVTVSYMLSEESKVTVSLISLTGKKIRDLNSEYQSPGIHESIWDLKDENGNTVPAGVYLCLISTPFHVTVCKILKL
ncbi:MAG TPA: cellulase family glycosylhydrolase [Bacteroidales bacterium]|nr:cellulase family glycosylhydrolase [Bacteroidales bacterium]